MMSLYLLRTFRGLFILFIIGGCLFLSSACEHDLREIDHRSMILGVGIDKGEEHNYAVSIQLPVFEGGMDFTGVAGDEFHVLTREADTLWEAFVELESITPSVLFLGQAKVVVIADEVAEEDLTPILDLFTREVQIANKMFVMIVDAPASEFLDEESPLITMPALYLDRFFKAEQKLARSRAIKLFEYLKHSYAVGNAGQIPLGRLLDDGSIEIEGLAILKNHQKVVEIHKREVGISTLLENQVLHSKNDKVTVKAEDEEDIDEFKVSLSHIHIEPSISYRKTRPVEFDIEFKGSGNIIEVSPDGRFRVDLDFIEKVEKSFERKLEEDTLQLINKLQEANVDPWLMGHRIAAYDSKFFDTLNWEEKDWQEAKFNISVEFDVNHSFQKGIFEKRKVGQ